MSNIVYFCFSQRGEAQAQMLNAKMPGKVIRVKGLHECVEREFRPGARLLFIGALGICVRGIAPFVEDKTSDPAVVVMDERGQFIIPVLSGHLGGANDWARELAAQIGAELVLTTATDINQVFAVDSYARRAGFQLLNPKLIKTVSTRLLEGRMVGIFSEFPIQGRLPTGLVIHSNETKPDEAIFNEIGESVGIVLSVRTHLTPFQQTLQLVPPFIHVGIGARRGTNPDQLRAYYLEMLDQAKIHPGAVADISSIDLKKDEPALLELAQTQGIPFRVFHASELASHSHLFECSAFVERITGVGNVCETAAYIASDQGRILIKKQSRDGMTLAIAIKERPIMLSVENDDA